jgi:hypothetical protein
VLQETLSATVNKKISKPDSRPSSTGIGFLGISMMVVVFGGLILLDATSLIAHAKLAYQNFVASKAAAGNTGAEATETDA